MPWNRRSTLANRYTERLTEAGIDPSLSSKGDSYDNALAETIHGLYKAELIHRRVPWKTVESLELATLEGVTGLNPHRLLEPIGYMPPAEAEQRYYLQLARQAEHVCTQTQEPLRNPGRFNHRLLEPIGNVPPAEAEAAYYRQPEESARVV